MYAIILAHASISLILSYLFLVETKGNNLDHVVVEDEGEGEGEDIRANEGTSFLEQ